jgi:Orsellinic acid/F9775 biosynthesis cluster protein D
MSDPSSWFSYNEEYDLLICIPCGFAVMPASGGGVSGHLDSMYGVEAKKFALPLKARRKLLQLHKSCMLNANQLNHRSGAPPIPHLTVHDGFFCHMCDYVCCKVGLMKFHARNDHEWLKRKGLPYPVLCQISNIC